MRALVSSWRWPSAIAATVIVAALATVAVANHNPGHKVLKGKAPLKTVVVTGTQDSFVDTNEWTNFPGAKAKIKVPDGGRALIVARFTAETVCSSFAPDHCSARILIGGREGLPASGRDFHIDSNYGSETDESEKAHAMDRSLEVGPGRHIVKVQGAAMGGMLLRIDDWSLTVETIAK